MLDILYFVRQKAKMDKVSGSINLAFTCLECCTHNFFAVFFFFRKLASNLYVGVSFCLADVSHCSTYKIKMSETLPFYLLLHHLIVSTSF